MEIPKATEILLMKTVMESAITISLVNARAMATEMEMDSLMKTVMESATIVRAHALGDIIMETVWVVDGPEADIIRLFFKKGGCHAKRTMDIHRIWDHHHAAGSHLRVG